MKKNETKRFTVFTKVMFVITGLYIAFIWVHSLMSAEKSTVESTRVLEFLINFMKSLGISAELTDHIVRKATHFCEFALLGCLTLWCGYLLNKNILKLLLPVGGICLSVAIIDEIIQIFSPGRSCQLSDVILDFTGSICGAVFFILIIIVILLIKKRKIKHD